MFLRELLELLVVDPLIVSADAVRHDVVQLAGEVQRVAVREMTAVGQVHAEHRIARLHRCEVHRHVGLRPGVRLDIRVFGAEERLGPRDGERLGHVDEFASSVVAPARVAFGVLVRHHRPGRFEYCPAHEVLRRDELEPFGLAARFVLEWQRRSRDRSRPGSGAWATPWMGKTWREIVLGYRRSRCELSRSLGVAASS